MNYYYSPQLNGSLIKMEEETTKPTRTKQRISFDKDKTADTFKSKKVKGGIS